MRGEGGDNALEELAAECKLCETVVKAVRDEAGVRTLPGSLSPITEVPDVAAAQPDTPRPMRQPTRPMVIMGAQLETPTTSVYLSLPSTPEPEVAAKTSWMVTSSSANSVHFLSPSSATDCKCLYGSVLNRRTAHSRTNVHVSFPNTLETSNVDLVTAASSHVGLGKAMSAAHHRLLRMVHT